MNNAKVDESRNSIRFPFGCDPVEAFQSQKAGGVFRPGLVDPGVRRLLLALLEDALDSYRKYFSKLSSKGETSFREVEEWIRSGAEGPFSFATVCEGLGIDPEWLRAELLRWKKKQFEAAKHGIIVCRSARALAVKRKHGEAAIRPPETHPIKRKGARSARP